MAEEFPSTAVSRAAEFHTLPRSFCLTETCCDHAQLLKRGGEVIYMGPLGARSQDMMRHNLSLFPALPFTAFHKSCNDPALLQPPARPVQRVLLPSWKSWFCREVVGFLSRELVDGKLARPSFWCGGVGGLFPGHHRRHAHP